MRGKAEIGKMQVLVFLAAAGLYVSQQDQALEAISTKIPKLDRPSLKTIKARLAELVDAGALIREDRAGKAPIYHPQYEKASAHFRQFEPAESTIFADIQKYRSAQQISKDGDTYRLVLSEADQVKAYQFFESQMMELVNAYPDVQVDLEAMFDDLLNKGFSPASIREIVKASYNGELMTILTLAIAIKNKVATGTITEQELLEAERYFARFTLAP